MVASLLVKLPLRIVLIAPFVLHLTAGVGFVSYFCFKNGQRAVEDMATQLMEEVSERIGDRLDGYLSNHQQIIQGNRLAVEQGLLDPTNLEQVRRHLWHQLTLHPSQAEIVFANEGGDSLFYGRVVSQDKADLARKAAGIDIPVGMFYFAQESRTRPGQRQYYQVDARGKPQKLIYTSPLESRNLPWYLYAKAVGKQTWSPILALKAIPTLGIIALTPIYNAAGKRQGVFASDFTLSDISTFLSQLQFSRSGQVFIIDRAGNLIATSTLERPYLPSAKGQPTPLLAANSRDPRTQTVSQHLAQKWGDFRRLQSPQQVRLVSQGEGLFVRVVPYRDTYGLDWLTIIIVPESDFMAQIYAHTYSTLWLSLGILGVAIALGLLTANRVTQRIAQINQASRELTEGNLDRPIEIASSVTELEELTQSFNGMAQQLRETFNRIQIALQESEKKFTTIFHTSPDPIAILTLTESRICEVNDSLIEFFGCSRTESIGRTTLELGWWANQEDRQQARKILQQEGKISNWESQARTKSGELKTVLLSAKVCNLEGVDCIIVAIKDISDRKALELALQTSESRLRAILNHASAFISGVRLLTNRTWEYEYFSAGIEAICGYTGEEIAAVPSLLMSLILPEDLETIVQPALDRFLTPNFSTTIEYRLRHRDGRIRWVANSLNTRWDEIAQGWYGTGILVDISDLKQAEAALQASESRLQQLATASPGVIYTVVEDPKGPTRYDYLSPAFEAIHEVSIAEVRQNPAIPFEQIHPEDREGYQQAVAKALEEMQLFRHEWRIRTPSGKIKWLQANSRPERRDNGEIIWYGIVLDVSDRKQAEEALRIASSRLQNLARAMPGVLYSLVQSADGSLKFEYINRAVEEIFELSVEQALKDAADLILGQMHPDDRASYLEAVDRNLETLETFIHEWRIITPSGKLKWVQAYSQAEPRSNNEICWHGMVLDISDRKWAEKALRQSQRALVEAQKIALMGSWSFDALTEEVSWSEEMFRIFGRDPALGEPTYDEIVEQTYPEDLEQLLENIERTLTQGQGFEHEIRIVRPDGSIHYTFGKGQAVLNESGKVVKLLGIVQDISDRKRAEAALRESEEKFRQLAENVPLFFGLRPADCSCWLYASPSFEQMSGRPVQLLYENPSIWTEIIHPDDRDWLTNKRSTNPLSEAFSAEFRIVKPDGEIRWIRADEFPVHNDAGKLYRMATFGEDITNRKLAEEALRQSENALAEAQRISHLGNWSFDVAAQVITWSEETYRIYGLDPTQDAPTYEQLLQQTHPDDLPVLVRNVERAITEGKAYEHEIAIVRPDGTLRHTLGKGQAIFNEAGQVVQLFGTVQDISDRKLAEIALRNSLEREKTLFQVTQKMRQTLDLETIFRTVTQDLRETLACSRISIYRCNPNFPCHFIAEAVASSLLPLVGNQINPIWQDFYSQMVRDMQENGQGFLAVNEINQAVFSDRYLVLLEPFHIRSFCSVPVEAGEQLWGVLSAYHNHTPRHWKSEEIQLLTQVGIQLGVAIQQAELFAQIQNQSVELQKAVDAANMANRAKSAFLANMSHELRTPLNAILGFAQLISQSSDFSEKDRENLATINWSGQHLLTLINDVLDMAKIESGCTVLNEQVFNLHHLLQDLEKMFNLKAREKGIKLIFRCHPDLPGLIQADGIKLRQVLINLVGNAIKFTQKGQVSLRVNLQPEERSQLGDVLPSSPIAKREEFSENGQLPTLLYFEVKDTGIGIPESEFNNIFEPFLQTRTGQQSQEGTGLGLAISRNFVELMGGKLTVSSEIGQGSTFCFYILVRLVEQAKDEFERPLAICKLDELETGEGCLTQQNEGILNPLEIANLPDCLTERLQKAVIRANWQEMYHIIDEISTINLLLSEVLKQLIEKFDYAEVLRAIEAGRRRADNNQE